MTQKRKIYLYLIVFSIITLFFLVWLLPYLFKEIQNNSEDLISLKQELVSLQKERENLEQLKVIYKTYELNLQKTDQIFIDPEVPVEFIDFLEETAQICQQEIEISLVSGKEIKEDPWPSLVFQISTSGSSPDFSRFLTKLENSPYLIDVSSLIIKRLAKEEAQPGNIQSTILIKVFAQSVQL